MEVRRFTGPPVDTHSYVVASRETQEAWVIDAPLDTADRVFRFLAAEGLRLTRAILTHAHFDHILDAERYQAAGVPLMLHPEDEVLLAAPQTEMFGVPLPMPVLAEPEPLAEGQQLELGRRAWDVWHVPGHAPGHVVLYSAADAVLLGGDMLFDGGFGRIDLPMCDPPAMRESLRRVARLPPETRVLPGHGPETTVGAELAWLQDLLRRKPEDW